MEKRDERGGMAAEGCQCTASMYGGRELAVWHIVDDCTTLGHGAQRHDPKTATAASKIADKPDLIYFNNTIELHIKIMSIVNGIMFILSTRGRGLRLAASIAAHGKCLLAAISANLYQLRLSADRADCALSTDA